MEMPAKAQLKWKVEQGLTPVAVPHIPGAGQKSNKSKAAAPTPPKDSDELIAVRKQNAQQASTITSVQDFGNVTTIDLDSADDAAARLASLEARLASTKAILDQDSTNDHLVAYVAQLEADIEIAKPTRQNKHSALARDDERLTASIAKMDEDIQQQIDQHNEDRLEIIRLLADKDDRIERLQKLREAIVARVTLPIQQSTVIEPPAIQSAQAALEHWRQTIQEHAANPGVPEELKSKSVLLAQKFKEVSPVFVEALRFYSEITAVIEKADPLQLPFDPATIAADPALQQRVEPAGDNTINANGLPKAASVTPAVEQVAPAVIPPGAKLPSSPPAKAPAKAAQPKRKPITSKSSSSTDVDNDEQMAIDQIAKRKQMDDFLQGASE